MCNVSHIWWSISNTLSCPHLSLWSGLTVLSGCSALYPSWSVLSSLWSVFHTEPNWSVLSPPASVGSYVDRTDRWPAKTQVGQSSFSENCIPFSIILHGEFIICYKKISGNPTSCNFLLKISLLILHSNNLNYLHSPRFGGQPAATRLISSWPCIFSTAAGSTPVQDTQPAQGVCMHNNKKALT